MSPAVHSHPLRRNLILTMLGIVFFALLFDRLYEYGVVRANDLDREHSRQLRELCYGLSRDYSSILLKGDIQELRMSVAARATNSQISRMILTDEVGKVIASTRLRDHGQNIRDVHPYFDPVAFMEGQHTNQFVLRKSSEREVLYGYAPVLLPPMPNELRALNHGVLFVEMDISQAKAASWQHLFSFDSLLRWFVTFSIAAVLLGYVLRRQLFQPLSQLERVAARLGRGEWSARSELVGEGELAVLGRTFNEMEDQIVLRIDELLRMEGVLRNERDFAEHLIETAQVIILLLDNEGRIVRYNPYLEKLSGFPLKEMQGKDWMDNFLPEHERIRVRALFENATSGIQTKGNVNTIRTRSGEERLVEWYDQPLTDAGGKITGVLAVGLDITERKRTEESLRISEQRYVQLVRTIPDGVYSWIFQANGTGGFTYVSPRFCEILDLDAESVLRDPMLAFTSAHPEDLQDLVDRNEQARIDMKPFRWEGRFLIRGETRWVRIASDPTPMPDAGSAWSGIVSDITEYKKVEAELHSYRHHLEDLVEQRTRERNVANKELATTQFAMDKAGIGIHWIDADTGRFQYVNDYAASLLGYSVEEMLAMGVPDVDPAFSEGNFAEKTAGLRELGASVVQTSEKHKDGHVIPIEVSFYYLSNENIFISFISDITERKRIQEELIRARDTADAANRAKSVFLANMSHELRTPLNAILGFSTMLQNNPDLTRGQRDEIAIINRSGNHLLTLINDVLEVAKIEAGRIELENAAFDLILLEQDVVDMMRLRAEKQGLQLLTDEIPPVPRYIFGDQARMRQILINLVGNAIKFTKQGGVTLRLGTRQNLEKHLLIEVEDSGIGIAPEDRKRVFEPFVQLGEHSVNRGTGLGLTITQQFVQLMGGSIELESEPGKGSLFRVSLPLHEATEADVTKQPELEPRKVIGLVPGQAEYRILIAEDQLENQLLLGRVLADLGLQYKTAEDGAKAVALFQSWEPQLILMDQRMPVMDGMEATRAIRELPGGGEVKIVAVTASAFKEQRDELLASGMDGFISKPYRPSEIYDCLATQLGVQFLYERGDQESKPVEAITPEILVTLSAPLRKRLKEALESLDSSRIRRVLSSVGDENAALEASLAVLTEDYNYPAILEAIAKCEQLENE